MQDKKVQEILKSFVEYTSILLDGITNICDTIREKGELADINTLLDCLDGLKWCVDVLSVIKNNLREKNILIDENKLSNIISKLLQAFENKDSIFIADLLEYEVIEMIKDYKKDIETIL